MTNVTQAANTQIAASEEEFVWPEYTPSPAHRHFLKRLKSARIERGLSIPDMAHQVGLTFRLANEFENGITPLPFCHLEVWCQAVGVPFDDYLTIYWADERDWAEREDARKEAERTAKAPCITNTEAPTLVLTAATATAPIASPSRGFSFLNSLRSVATHIRDRFLSRFSTHSKTPK